MILSFMNIHSTALNTCLLLELDVLEVNIDYLEKEKISTSQAHSILFLLLLVYFGYNNA